MQLLDPYGMTGGDVRAATGGEQRMRKHAGERIVRAAAKEHRKYFLRRLDAVDPALFVTRVGAIISASEQLKAMV